MKQTNALKLTVLGASVAALGVGCASTGYARYDGDNARQSHMGASASAEVGTDRDTTTTHAALHDSSEKAGSSRVTVSALSFTPDTRATWVNKYPFWDSRWQTRTITMYTFAVPDPTVDVTSADAPQFSVNLPPGSVFVESAGGAGEARVGRVIQHSPAPIR